MGFCFPRSSRSSGKRQFKLAVWLSYNLHLPSSGTVWLQLRFWSRFQVIFCDSCIFTACRSSRWICKNPYLEAGFQRVGFQTATSKATVSVLCRRSKEDYLAWGTYARTNSGRFNSWPKRADLKNPGQDGFFGFPGLFNLHSSVYSHPRSHSTRPCWNCCLQRHADGLKHNHKWDTDIQAREHRSSPTKSDSCRPIS